MTGFSNRTGSSGFFSGSITMSSVGQFKHDIAKAENVAHRAVLNVDMSFALGNCLILSGINFSLIFSESIDRIWFFKAGQVGYES